MLILVSNYSIRGEAEKPRKEPCEKMTQNSKNLQQHTYVQEEILLYRSHWWFGWVIVKWHFLPSLFFIYCFSGIESVLRNLKKNKTQFLWLWINHMVWCEIYEKSSLLIFPNSLRYKWSEHHRKSFGYYTFALHGISPHGQHSDGFTHIRE